MAFNPENEQDVSRLTTSIEWSLGRLKPYRRKRVEHLKLFVGKHYGDDGSKDNRPINMIELGIQIFQRGLSSHSPQAKVTSDYKSLAPYARDLELVLNQQIQRINLRESFNLCTIEALFQIGCMVVGITGQDTPPDGDNYLHDPGQVFADPVLFDDLVLDMNARSWDEQFYMGHDFFVPVDWARENPQFDKSVRELITSQARGAGDDNSERYEERNRAVMSDEFEDTVRLRQLFLPSHKLLVTMAPDFSGNKLLSAVPWEGPERGPYIPLVFGNVPGRLLPVAPVPTWRDLDSVINTCYNKAADQALRQKKISMSNDENDSARVRDAQDGDHIFSPQAGDVQEVSYGGADQGTLAMVLWSKQMLSYMGGNWDAIAGLSAQTRTVGQDELLAASASMRMKDMQQTVIEFQTQVIEQMAYWLWDDPVSEYHIVKPVGSQGYSIETTVTPESRMGKFFDYNFRVNPYSLQNMSPAEEANRLMMLLTQFVMPALPGFMQQGIGVDWEACLKLLADKMNMPELNKILVYMQGQQIPEQEPIGMPSNTTRTYERVNRPAGTVQGNDQAMMKMLLGGGEGVQASELAGLARPAQ